MQRERNAAAHTGLACIRREVPGEVKIGPHGNLLISPAIVVAAQTEDRREESGMGSGQKGIEKSNHEESSSWASTCMPLVGLIGLY